MIDKTQDEGRGRVLVNFRVRCRCHLKAKINRVNARSAMNLGQVQRCFGYDAIAELDELRALKNSKRVLCACLKVSAPRSAKS